MSTTPDSGGRVVVPKAYRDTLGLTPGWEADISPFGAGLRLTLGPATLVEKQGRLVARGKGLATDEIIYALIDAGRK